MLALTERQREEMRVQGYTVMESFFQGAELEAIVSALEASIEAKNRGVDEVADIFLDLVDHQRILPCGRYRHNFFVVFSLVTTQLCAVHVMQIRGRYARHKHPVA